VSARCGSKTREIVVILKVLVILEVFVIFDVFAILTKHIFHEAIVSATFTTDH
jgi:hypothetical protein